MSKLLFKNEQKSSNLPLINKNVMTFQDILNSTDHIEKFVIDNYLEGETVLFVDIVNDYKAYLYTCVISNNELIPKDVDTLNSSNNVGFVTALSTYRARVDNKYFCLIVDTSDENKMRYYLSTYSHKNFAKTKRLNVILMSEYNLLVNKEKQSDKVDTVSMVCYDKKSSITYSTSIVDKLKYIEEIQSLIEMYPVSELNYFSHGNLYVFIDCEKVNNQVNEVAILITYMRGTLLIPISKVVCKDPDPVKTCAQFASYYPQYLEELKIAWDVGKVFYVGHNVQSDIRDIYLTLGIDTPFTYSYIDTGSAAWHSIWSNITVGPDIRSSIKLEDLKNYCALSNNCIKTLTEDIFGVKDTKQHTAMYDVTLLYTLLNLLLLKQVDIEAYRSFHFKLINESL